MANSFTDLASPFLHWPVPKPEKPNPLVAAVTDVLRRAEGLEHLCGEILSTLIVNLRDETPLSKQLDAETKSSLVDLIQKWRLRAESLKAKAPEDPRDGQ